MDDAPFRFRRYINGEERAEGVTIEKEPTLEAAMAKAVRIASRRAGEILVLVLEPAVAAPEGVGLTRWEWTPHGMSRDWPKGGEWVRHDDAAAALARLRANWEAAARLAEDYGREKVEALAALAAKDAEIHRLTIRVSDLTVHRDHQTHRADAAEAQVATLKEALVAAKSSIEDSNVNDAYLTLCAAPARAERAALSTPPAPAASEGEG